MLEKEKGESRERENWLYKQGYNGTEHIHAPPWLCLWRPGRSRKRSNGKQVAHSCFSRARSRPFSHLWNNNDIPISLIHWTSFFSIPHSNSQFYYFFSSLKRIGQSNTEGINRSHRMRPEVLYFFFFVPPYRTIRKEERRRGMYGDKC